MRKSTKRLSLLLAVIMLMTTIVIAPSSVGAATTNDISSTGATVDTAETSAGDSPFSWDNATVYFLLTDRFNNGDTSNDHSYNRLLNRDGSVASNANTVAAFQGGDFTGITKKIEDGYFDDLGINALWIAGTYEQIHGYCVGGDGKSSFAHYSYHGYYGLDWTETDKNFGTKAEFKKLVDTAHEHGIRVVMDVVMNHAGYNTMYDMNEYNFGTLKSGWQDVYYNWSSINKTKYHGKIDYNSNSSDWAKWWGPSWLRAGLAGYTQAPDVDADPIRGSVNYLPDFKTESSVSGLPTILQTKWNKEGTYAAKNNAANAWFSKTGYSKTVSNYLVYWLSEWVREYGVDGFRCDTAKHVEMDAWGRLNTECTKALKEWKAANSTKALDDAEFWSTAEVWGQGLNYNDYYKNGGFDSVINFSFSADNRGNGANGLPAASSINSTYANYANQINTNDKFNVLTYISSHDTGLCRVSDMYYQGSALMMLPGGVQVYYGDETNRPKVSCTIHDHTIRSFMNWSSADSNLLAHWQKVGTFRNNHISVGAGTHTSLSASSGAAFARKYSKNGVEDGIVACIGANNNSNITLTVSSVFANGTEVRNAYDGKTATVTNGTVTFNSGAHGTILVEAASGATTKYTVTFLNGDGSVMKTQTVAEGKSATAPTATPVKAATDTHYYEFEKWDTDFTNVTTDLTVKPIFKAISIEKIMLGDADLSDSISIRDASTIQKYLAKMLTLTDKALNASDVDGNGTVSIFDATLIQKYLAKVNVNYPIGSYVGGNLPTEPPTDPTQAPTDPDPTEPISDTNTIKFTDANKWGTIYLYAWNDGSGEAYAEWPGTAMTVLEQDNGYGQTTYTIDVPSKYDRIIFTTATGSPQSQDITWDGSYEGYWPTSKTQTNSTGSTVYVIQPWGVDEDGNPV